MASLSASGLVPISAAIAGSEVAITVESMFSMNRATAMISGTMRSRGMGRERWGRERLRQSEAVEYQSGGRRKAVQAITASPWVAESSPLGMPAKPLHSVAIALGIAENPCYRPTPTQKRAVKSGEGPLATGVLSAFGNRP